MSRPGLSITSFVLVFALVAMAPPAVPPAVPAPAPSLSESLAAVEDALSRKDYDRALTLYQQARAVRPESPELPYNMGVAAYRAGRPGEAADHFRDALSLTDDPALRARTAYNLGTAAYAKALREQNPLVSGGGPPTPDATSPPSGSDLGDATKELAEALNHYRSALEESPADADARFNAEMTQRMLTRLQEIAQQQPSPDQEQQSDENQDGEEQEQQQQQPGEQTEDQENATEQQRAQQQQQQGEDEQKTPEQTQPDEDPGEEESEEESEENPTPAEDSEEAEEPSGGEREQEDRRDGKEMSRAEAERLLQSVRDKERRRREQLARDEASRHPPVDKDW